MKGICIAVAAAVLAACTTRPTLVQDRPTAVNVPVMVGCVAGERPEPVTPLKQLYPLPQWKRFTVKQKAELEGAQGAKHQSYGQDLNAATGACP